MKFICLALLLAGCQLAPTKPVVPDEPVLSPKSTIVIPPSLIAPCSPLTNIDDTKTYNQGESTDVVSVWANEHTDCATRFKKYVDLTAPALNINQVPAGAPVPASGTPILQ